MGESQEPYQLIPLETYDRSLKEFDKSAERKIRDKVEEMLPVRPKEYEMLEGPIRISGQRIAGLRHMKVGIQGVKGGAYVLYRICEECKQYGYAEKSDVQCQFCDEEKGKHVVLFFARRRGAGYGWL